MKPFAAMACAFAGSTLALAVVAAEPAKFSVDDLVRVANITDLDLSPDGEYVVYSVGEPNLKADKPQYDVWRAHWDGSDKRALTKTPDSSEWQPAFSPDGKRIAFLSDRGDEDAEDQVWMMPVDAGEAAQLTSFPGGVVDFDWSPDGKTLAVIAKDPERRGGRGKAATAEADRHRPLPVQGRLHRPPDRQAPAPLSLRHREPQADAAHDRPARPVPARLVAGRPPDRLRYQAWS